MKIIENKLNFYGMDLLNEVNYFILPFINISELIKDELILIFEIYKKSSGD